MPVLPVRPDGTVGIEVLDSYLKARHEEVGKKLHACLEGSSAAQGWLRDLSVDDLYELKDGSLKYMGDAAAEEDAKAVVERVKVSDDPTIIVAVVEELIMRFCGFKAKCFINALHFQYNVDIARLVAASLPLPSDDEALTDAEKELFDDANIGGAELLLRCVVETGDGGILANPFSPGMPMGKLLKLPLLAQLVMVLTNAVEAVWYQEAIPSCPMSINVYASLLQADAPVLQMVAGVDTVEVMELTKGAKRGPEVDEWVRKIRETGATVLLDDFDPKHPGIDSSPDGIKVCVFVNAYHSLQAFKNEAAGSSATPLLPMAGMPFVEKDQVNPFDMVDFYGSLVQKHQHGARVLVMEGSENCLKSEIQGPPFNFSEPKATIASAHVYQAAARSLCASQPEGQSLQMLHQGGRALYDDEDFDEDACAVIAASGKQMAVARTGDAGTMAWIGAEAVRRAAMQQRPLVCGLMKK